MMKFKRAIYITAALLALLVVAPFLIPTGTYLKQVEQLVSDKLGQPVTIGALHVALLPTPRIRFSDVRIGRNEEIRVERVVAVPAIATLFSPVKVISRIEVQQPVIKKAALDILDRLAEAPGGTAPVAVRHIAINGARLEWEEMNLPAVNVALTFSNEGKPELAVLTSVDGKLKVDVVPKGEGYAIMLAAQKWTPPAGPALVFDSIHANMMLQGKRLDVSALSARLYGGALAGTATLNWAKDWLASGKFKAAGIEMGEATKLLSKNMHVSGRLSGNGTFGGSAKDAAALAERMTLDFRFDVASGVLYGMDLAQAASLFVKQGQHGGETRFDELSGMLHAVGKQYELRELKVASGLLAANGGVKISPAKKLDGQVDVELKKGVALVTVPLQVSGTLDEPVVMPTKAAMAGAVAGTAILGPLGTSLGMKAGSAIDKLFGGNKKK
jgi:uncharacterized protein involved in outer membrane biogenesis